MVSARLRRAVASLALAAAIAVVGTAAAAAQPPACVATSVSAAGPVSAGSPCWTDTSPYPFGFDGTPVDPTSATCRAQVGSRQDPNACYLVVDSMAFRAWNRGLAVVSPPVGLDATTPFGVWLYNGVRWFADPTFPGQSACKGSTVVWAGKLDYWLVGDVLSGGAENWPALCRFDGPNYAWEPISVPKAALAHVPLIGLDNHRAAGAITAGACTAWNNCWFFGSYGIVLHWDGGSLVDATPDPSAPWLRSDYTAAVARTDLAGNPFAVAVSATSDGQALGPPTSQPTPAEPDGSPAPQFFESSGGAFTPTGFTPPTNPLAGDPFQTDLVAVDFNQAGQGWVAGNPRGVRVGGSRGSATAEPAPLAPVTTGGSAVLCRGTPPDTFTGRLAGSSVTAQPGFVWSSLSVLPGGDAIAGGEVFANNTSEPVLADVSCSNPPVVVKFRTGATAAANPNGYISSVVANASNDAWAATLPANAVTGGGIPHLYRFTDGQPPLAPAGDDIEARPLPVPQQPSLFVLAPPVVTAPPPPTRVVRRHGRTRHRRVRLPPPINHVRVSKLTPAGSGRFKLVISFRVVRAVTIGARALRHRTVVSSSGLKTFRGRSGSLTLVLDPKRWPTKIEFVQPPVKKKKNGHK
jgi:hypothetical protein